VEWVLIYTLFAYAEGGLEFKKMERQIEAPYAEITEQEECEMQKALMYEELIGGEGGFIAYCEPVPL